jgi:hypothetical protein
MTTVPYTFGNEPSPIPLSQLDANFATTPQFANTAGNVVNAVQANITSVGVLTSVSVSGNVNSGNLRTVGSVSATGNITAGNVAINSTISAFGTVTGGNLATSGTASAGNITTGGTVIAAGNVTSGNITTSGQISAQGNILAQGIVSAIGNIVTDAFFVGNFLGNITGNLSVGGANTQILFNSNGNVGAAGGLTYNSGSNTLGILGVVSAQGNIIAGGNLVVSGTTQLVGVATAPTAPTGTANNQVATTAFVTNIITNGITNAVVANLVVSETTQLVGTVSAQGNMFVGGDLVVGGTTQLVGVATAPTPANATSNTQIATTEFVRYNGFPSGGIVMWSGSIASIPAGWFLCDGGNSTPDLRNRFIVGAGSTYSVADTGGFANAVVVSHSHTASSVVTDPTHAHSTTFNQTSKSNNATPYILSNPNIGENLNGSVAIPTTAQTTGITVATSISTAGVSGVNANLPPYYALSYIMKA